MKNLFILFFAFIFPFIGTTQTLVPYLKKNGKKIFVDSATMKPVIFKEYRQASFFYEGLAAVQLDGKTGYEAGYVNKKGQEVIPLKYENTSDFTDGLGRVSQRNGVGFVDKTGKEVIAVGYNIGETFYEGFAAVADKDDKYGFINRSGKAITPFKYDEAGNFHEGLAWVKADKKYGFIDATGKEITPLKYRSAQSFNEDMAIVEINRLKGFINKAGEEIIPLQYDEVEPFNEGLACVGKEKYGYVDASGKEMIPLIYDYAENFNKGLAAVAMDNKYQIINKKGEVILDLGGYRRAHISRSGIIYAQLNKEEATVGGKWVMLDKAGNRLNTATFDKVENYDKEVLMVSINDLWGMNDRGGNEVIACKYAFLTSFDERNGFADAISVPGEPLFHVDKAGREYRDQ